MTTPIQSAKTAKEMLAAVCEDLEDRGAYYARVAQTMTRCGEDTLADEHHGAAEAIRSKITEYRAILKEME